MKVIVDCDPGNGIPATDVDDGLAVGLALASPHVELLAITIVSGNTHRDVGYAVASDMLKRIGASVPLYAGAARSLVEDPEPWIERAEEKLEDPRAASIWEGVRTPDLSVVPRSFEAANQIARLVAENPGEVTIVAVGPLTNIAHALQLYPQLADEVAEIIIMGGAFNVPGFLQELNFGIDPEAAQYVLASGAPITLVPLDVTSKTLMTRADLQVLANSPGALVEFLVETGLPWARYCEVVREQDGFWLHDPLAMALALDRSLVEVADLNVEVEVSGVSRSRPIAWRVDELRMSAGLNLPERRLIQVVTSADNERLVETMLQVLGGTSKSD